tara:strand:- start:122 stop:433 length:312 start_codon:yes stop_codon:yes gene_type:complete
VSEKKINQQVVCADGFTMSVQAHVGAYCSPRINNAQSYSEVEIGFPTAKEPLLMEYCEEPTDPTGTVYAYVPAQVVVNVIAKHGGMVEGEIPPGIPALRASSR